METYAQTIPDKRKNACAVNLMRTMLVKYAQKHDISFEDALIQFSASSTYGMLFDFDTAVWKEGPDYLLSLYEEELAQDATVSYEN